MKTWKFELLCRYILVSFNERYNEYKVEVRTEKGYAIDTRIYKSKGAINRYLKSWGIEEKI